MRDVDASLAFDKVSREKTMTGRILYSPAKLNRLFKNEFTLRGWNESRIDYFVNEDLNITRDFVKENAACKHTPSQGRSNPPVILAGVEP